MSKPSVKEVHTLAGQVDAACIILREVTIATYKWGNIDEDTRAALIAAEMACKKTRKALRAISYEVENAREDS